MGLYVAVDAATQRTIPRRARGHVVGGAQLVHRPVIRQYIVALIGGVRGHERHTQVYRRFGWSVVLVVVREEGVSELKRVVERGRARWSEVGHGRKRCERVKRW